ncbi:MAG: hypothetical protein GX825_07810 [Syntrophomonadaceae bacterium]|nr:hypothetical protein [Syntrophomonadaceae bacterium]
MCDFSAGTVLKACAGDNFKVEKAEIKKNISKDVEEFISMIKEFDLLELALPEVGDYKVKMVASTNKPKGTTENNRNKMIGTHLTKTTATRLW